jgi:Pyruvate/2-oxoacid:ferredoxin oxidoreductase delta subunit
MAEHDSARRVIQVQQNILGPREPRPKSVRVTKFSDYPAVPKVHLEVAQRLSSPLLLGPPICDELVALVQHLFTEEEAALVRHLRALIGKSAPQIARAEHRSRDQVEAILDELAFGKRAIACSGRKGEHRYQLLPLLPGVFEMVLVNQSPESLSEWHRRFAELFEALFETGFSVDYVVRPTTTVRYLPVGKSIDAHPMALPSDRLEVVLDQFDAFAVGKCQCRTSAAVAGHACDRPLENCMVMGRWTKRGVRDGWLRPVSKDEALAIKREAESHGLVTWMMNVESSRSQVSCSCCGCCCKAMRLVNEFNAPSVVAPPHFLPKPDFARCTFCGKCARHCPMGAIALDLEAKTYRHLPERCIGCGLCAVACDRQQAIAMEPVPDYRLPYRSWFSLLMHNAPGLVQGSWHAWRQRRNADGR